LAVAVGLSKVPVLPQKLLEELLPGVGSALFKGRNNLSTPGFLSPDAYYAVHRNPRINVFARHNSK
jgi:hypothetical protein